MHQRHRHDVEWLSGCRHWQHSAVRSFIRKYQLQTCKFHGCAYGLTGVEDGLPILKPWRVETNCEEVTHVLNKACSKHHVHGQCRGRNATASAGSTEVPVTDIHRAWGFAATNMTTKAIQIKSVRALMVQEFAQACQCPFALHSRCSSSHCCTSRFGTPAGSSLTRSTPQQPHEKKVLALRRKGSISLGGIAPIDTGQGSWSSPSTC